MQFEGIEVASGCTVGYFLSIWCNLRHLGNYRQQKIGKERKNLVLLPGTTATTTNICFCLTLKDSFLILALQVLRVIVLQIEKAAYQKLLKIQTDSALKTIKKPELLFAVGLLTTVNSQIKAAPDYKPLPIVGRTKLPNLYNICRSRL